MLSGFRHWLAVERMLRSKKRTSKLFEDRIRAATKGGYETTQASNLRNEWQWEMSHREDEIDITVSDHLMSLASRYRIPSPTDEGDWEKSTEWQRRYLTKAGASKLRTALRVEQKARWDYWQTRISMISSIIGVVGGIMGAIAYFKPHP